MDVPLRILREAAGDSGQSTVADGLRSSSFNIRPLTSNRLFKNTGVATAELFPAEKPSRHNNRPVARSRLLTDCEVQTTNCLRPPVLMRIGHAWLAVSFRLDRKSVV